MLEKIQENRKPLFLVSSMGCFIKRSEVNGKKNSRQRYSPNT